MIKAKHGWRYRTVDTRHVSTDTVAGGLEDRLNHLAEDGYRIIHINPVGITGSSGFSSGLIYTLELLAVHATTIDNEDIPPVETEADINDH